MSCTKNLATKAVFEERIAPSRLAAGIRLGA
jgi:hypothetical protein